MGAGAILASRLRFVAFEVTLSASDAARSGALFLGAAFVDEGRILVSGDLMQLLRVDKHLDVIQRGAPVLCLILDVCRERWSNRRMTHGMRITRGMVVVMMIGGIVRKVCLRLCI